MGITFELRSSLMSQFNHRKGRNQRYLLVFRYRMVSSSVNCHDNYALLVHDVLKARPLRVGGALEVEDGRVDLSVNVLILTHLLCQLASGTGIVGVQLSDQPKSSKSVSGMQVVNWSDS
jgi:hypothetical protein